jgi:hypothetical protein
MELKLNNLLNYNPWFTKKETRKGKNVKKNKRKEKK